MSEGYKFWESGASDKLLSLNRPNTDGTSSQQLVFPTDERHQGYIKLVTDPDELAQIQLTKAIDDLSKAAVDKVCGPTPQDVLRTLPSDGVERKQFPITTGVLDYFPLALAEVARCSKSGNDQHNPGQPLHWARGKSSDHPDCLIRHLIQRGTLDSDGVRHSAKVAWRALAFLQEELESESGFIPKEGDTK